MQLNITSDYAVRCVLYLATKGGLSSASEISSSTGMNKAYAQQILRILRDAGIVNSELGNTGGYSLAKKPEDISLYDVVLPFEKTLKINRCLEDDRYCNVSGVNHSCTVHSFYVGLQSIIEEYMTGATIRSLMS